VSRPSKRIVLAASEVCRILACYLPLAIPNFFLPPGAGGEGFLNQQTKCRAAHLLQMPGI